VTPASKPPANAARTTSRRLQRARKRRTFDRLVIHKAGWPGGIALDPATLDRDGS
jgi:hypothetical protein